MKDPQKEHEERYKEASEVIRASLTQGETQRMAYTRAGIAETTYYRWKQEKPEFVAMIKQAEADFRSTQVGKLTQSLYKRATGYEATDIRTEFGVGANGQPVIIKQVKTQKQIPPDTGALIFTLCNLDPTNWQNKARTELLNDETFTGFRVEVINSDPQKSKEKED